MLIPKGLRISSLFDRFWKPTKHHRDINWTLADQAVVSGASFLTAILIARFLGPNEFGLFALAYIGLFFASTLQMALILLPMMTIGAKIPMDERPSYIGTLAVHQALLAVALSGLVLVAVPILGGLRPEWRLSELAGPLALAVLCGQIAEYLRHHHFTFKRPYISFALDAARYSGQALLLLALFLFLREDASVSAAFYVMSVTSAGAALVGVHKYGPIRLDRAAMRRFSLRHWRFSRWLLPNAIAMWAQENVVFAAVGAVIGLVELGALRASQQLVLVVNVPLQGFGKWVPMRAGVAFAAGGYPSLLEFVKTFVLKYMLAIAMMLILIALFGDYLLTTVYGESYADYGYLIAAWAAVMIVYLVRSIASIMLHAMEITSYEFLASVLGTIAIMLLTYPLVHLLGLKGALMSLFLFEVIMLAVFAMGLSKISKSKLTQIEV